MQYKDFELAKKLPDCPACKSADIEDSLVSIDDDWSVAGFKNSHCRHCGTYFTNPRPSARSLADFYDNIGDNDQSYVESSLKYYLDTERRRQMKENYLDALLKYRDGGKLLDFGCGAGWFMKLAEDHGFEVHGIEFMQATVNAGREKLGLSTLFQGSEENVPRQPTYDIVVCNNLIEHVADPWALSIRLRQALKAGGLLFFTYPSASSFLFRQLREYSYYYMNPYHLTHFTDQGMTAMLERAGFGDIAVERQKETYYWSHGICHRNGLLDKYKKWREDPDFVKYDIIMDNFLSELAFEQGDTFNKIALAEVAA